MDLNLKENKKNGFEKAQKCEENNKAHFLHPVVTLEGGCIGWPLALSTISLSVSFTWMEQGNSRQESTKQHTMQMEQANNLKKHTLAWQKMICNITQESNKSYWTLNNQHVHYDPNTSEYIIIHTNNSAFPIYINHTMVCKSSNTINVKP